ncbi:MAG: glycosyltransferase family 39 protein [Patescibacteria group bacterium]|nr:glycosyltransferase family 39 protein [Patescibacteria group bacterium]
MKYKYIFIGIVLLGFFLRFYKLGEIPNGLYQDETAIGWNAYSILKTGKDEYGKSLPVYFKSFGDHKLPVYVYLTTISVYLFGLTPFSVRLPSALFGSFAIPAFYFLVKKLTNNQKLAFISMLFLCINPWHLHYSRATFEVSIVLFLFIIGILCFFESLQKKHGMLILSAICFVVAIYSYNLTRLLSPFLFFTFLFFYRKQLHFISLKEKIITAIVIAILLIPFFFTYFDTGGVSSARGTLIFSSASVQAPILEFRSYFVDIPLVNKILFNSATLTIWQYITNIAKYFSVDFFFINGSHHGNHGIGTHGQFYLFELPMMLYGVYLSLQRKEKNFFPLFLVGLTTVLVASLTRESPHATRSFPLLIFLPVMSSYGFIHFIDTIIKQRRIVAYFFFTITMIAITFSVFHYFFSYYKRFPIFYAKQWRQQDRYVARYIEEHMDSYDRILIDTEARLIYSSLLFYLKFPPEEFHRTVIRKPDDSEGMSEVVSFGKFYYQHIDVETERKNEKTIIVTIPEKVPSHITPYKTFLYPQRPVVISKKQEILQYPTQDTAYAIVSSIK